MNKEFDYSMNNKWVIRINTKHPDGDAYDGIVLDYNRKYVVLRVIDDFEPDGIIFIFKKNIKSIRNGKLEKSFNAVISFCKTLKSLKETGWFHGMKTLEEIMSYLKSQSTWPSIEVVHDNGSSLYIGEITEVSKSSFSINCYDAEGRWEKIYQLKYDTVFKIEIDGKYVRHFNDYMRATN